MKKVIRGEVVSFSEDLRVALHLEKGAVAVDERGRIGWVGEAAKLPEDWRSAPVEDHGSKLVLPGFIDAHIHFPQYRMLAAPGKDLLDWLRRFTFPEEARYADAGYAAAAADAFLSRLFSHGTTAALAFCSVHKACAEALFTAATSANMALVTGKTMMDRNAIPAVQDTPETGARESEELYHAWHGKGRNRYAVTPRFAITSSEAQLKLSGELLAGLSGALMQTHISENVHEIEQAKALHPYAEDYLDIYDKHGLLGPGANFGHCIHLSPREVQRLWESGSGISHCPTSNLFIGSGLFDMRGLRDCNQPIRVGLATDVGGGSSFSMFHTMKASYEICQLQNYNLHPAKAFYLATLGSAQVMRLDRILGNLRAGFDADVIVLDLASQPLIATRLAQVDDIFGALFLQMILADDRAVRATYVAGRKAYAK